MRSLCVVAVMLLAGCRNVPQPVHEAATSFVELALALERRVPGYVDAHLGGRDAPAPALVLELEEIATRAFDAAGRLDELDTVRANRLGRELRALGHVASAAGGEKLGFAEELTLLYGTEPPPRVSEEEAAELLARVELPVEATIPNAELERAAERALAECRRRSAALLSLPEAESVRIEYARGQPWSSYHLYNGDYRSTIRINRDVRWTEPQLLEAVCHESYPGHHAMTVLTDEHLVRSRGLREYEVLTLPSPRAFLMERIARAGFAKAFPDAPTESRELEPLSVEGARRYIDGELDRVATVLWLEEHAGMPDAWPFLRFVDRYRSFVVAYGYRDDGDDFDALLETWLNGADET